MDWTREQKQAIEEREKNILVAAAAGSGKTAVLVERITQLIVKDRVDIDRFLITTFTNAASSEMKERLEKAINREMERANSDKAFLKRQIALLPKANISTFHTFAIEVLHKYFYVTGLEPGLKICDDVERDIMESESIDALFEQRFESDYDRFTAFLSGYSKERNEKSLKKNILDLYKKLRSIPDYLQWADEKTELLRSDSPMEAFALYDSIAAASITALRRARVQFCRALDVLEDGGIESLWNAMQQDLDKLDAAIEACKRAHDGKEIMEIFAAYCSDKGKYVTARVLKSEKEDFEMIKKTFQDHRNKGKGFISDTEKKYYVHSVEELEAEIKERYDDTQYLVTLIKDLEQIFKEKKEEQNKMDFDDVMHDAIEILKNEQVSAEYRDKFRYIFIDEFQDSNLLQEAIVSRIARENNVFMVGDVKQSIYRFRQAEPDIFRRKYAAYQDGEIADSIKIDLNTNFRSKNKVIDTVNKVFRSIMEGYDDNAALKVNPVIDGIYPGLDTQVYLLNWQKAEQAAAEKNEVADRTELEMQLIADVIDKNVGLDIYDIKQGCMRKTDYKDIAVLTRNGGMVKELDKFLNSRGIPAYGAGDDGYFETVEIMVFTNLLRVVDNTRQDVPLISVMRCPVFGFTLLELAEIRRFAGKGGTYYDAVQRYRKEGPAEQLKAKVGALLEQIGYWKELKHTVSLEELVRVLLYDTGYFDYCCSLPAGKQRIYNLRLLVEKAARYEEDHYGGLYGFLSYVDAIQKNDNSIEEAKVLTGEENHVNLMTIHKSKGLEFPVVILAETGKAYRQQGETRSPAMHKDIGIGLPKVNVKQRWYKRTILQQVINDANQRDGLAEEIRILYVAMTRAMDRFIMTGVYKEMPGEDFESKMPLTILYGAMKQAGAEILDRDVTKLLDFSGTELADGQPALTELFDTSRVVRDEVRQKQIAQKLDYRYPHSHLDKVKSKYSVTEINQREAKKAPLHHLREAGVSEREKPLNAAEIGTAMHLVMEKLDFQEALYRGTPYIRQETERLCREGWLTKEAYAAIDVDNIEAFFREPVGQRAAKTQTLEKEREFLLQTELDGVETLVQGIIDCFFEEEDGLVLIDYKNSHLGAGISEEDIAERYVTQLALYKEALEAAKEKPVKEAYLYLFELQRFVKVI